MSIEEVSIYVFFISAGLLFYAYLGYGLLAMFIGILVKKKIYHTANAYIVPLSVIIPAYNEAGILQEKIKNTLEALKNFKTYQVILITDGSTDGSSEMTFSQSEILHIHAQERKGKSSAINMAMQESTGEIIVITDANAMVNPEAFEKMVVRFKNEKTGAVSGEKRVVAKEGSTGGEGFYWKYESFIKKKSAGMYSLTGAAGELFSFRKNLFKSIPEDAILDDMVLSLNIIRQGKVIDYEPAAFAIEPPSKSIQDEFKRKIRISAGVFQTLSRNSFVFNPFKHTLFVFQFISHRVLRWTAGVVCIGLLLISNIFLLNNPQLLYTNLLKQPLAVCTILNVFFNLIFILQSLFYAIVIFGFFLRNNKKTPTFFFLPFYFIMMNIAVVVGFFRYLTGKETVMWNKADR